MIFTPPSTKIVNFQKLLPKYARSSIKFYNTVTDAKRIPNTCLRDCPYLLVVATRNYETSGILRIMHRAHNRIDLTLYPVR